jgi:NTE family protein
METAVVFQGGGALGAYEVGVVRRLAKEPWFPPDVVTGVSIGAINAALLAGGRYGAVETLQRAWCRLAMDLPRGLPAAWQEAVANYSNPSFYRPRLDLATVCSWTYLYEVGPLRRLLCELIDFDKLNNPDPPMLVLTAVDVETGDIQSFTNRDRRHPLAVEHIQASGALPPSFSMVSIDGRQYWDGGVFSNTPLGQAIGGFQSTDEKLLIVVNLFRNDGRLPQNIQEVGSRFLQIMFSNKISADVDVAEKYNQFVTTMDKIEQACPNIDEVMRGDPGWARLRQYDHIHSLVIEPEGEADEIMQGGHNFAREIIEKRMELGFRDADRILSQNNCYRQLAAKAKRAAPTQP